MYDAYDLAAPEELFHSFADLDTDSYDQVDVEDMLAGKTSSLVDVSILGLGTQPVEEYCESLAGTGSLPLPANTGTLSWEVGQIDASRMAPCLSPVARIPGWGGLVDGSGA